MSKLRGIKPNRITLGAALQRLRDSDDVDKDTELDAQAAGLHGLSSDGQAARTLFGRPDYPNVGANPEQQPSRLAIDGQSLGEGVNDIAPAAKRAVASVVQSAASSHNSFRSGDTHGDSSSGRRGDNLQNAETNVAKGQVKTAFTHQVKTARPGHDGVDNFERLSRGGSPTNGRDNVSPLGGFFTAEQINKMVNKLGNGGLPLRDLALPLVFGEGVASPNSRPAGLISSQVHDVLEQNNRFSPSENSPYIKNPSSRNEKDFFARGLYSVQTSQGKLGVYNPNGKEVHTIDLQQMALQLMVRAQSHTDLAGMIDESFAKGDSGGSSFLFDLAALVPGLTQIGAARINQEFLRIKNSTKAVEVFGHPLGSDDFIIPTTGDVVLGAGPTSKTDGNISPKSAGSYGTMNSFVEPFDGPMPFGMFFIALYSILAIMVLSLIIEGIMSAAGSAAPFAVGPKGSGSPTVKGSALELGAHRKASDGSSISDMFFSLFGLPRLNNNFAACLFRGLERFYDIPSIFELKGNFDAVLESAVNLALAPGYYATITKQVLRDFEQVTEAVLSIGMNASVFNVIAGIFKLVETLFASFTFRFMVFLMNLGNIDLISRKQPGHAAHGQLVMPVKEQKKLLKSIKPTPYARMRMSRFYINKQIVNPMSLASFPALFSTNQFGLMGNLPLTFVGDKAVKAKDIIQSDKKLLVPGKNTPTKEQVQEVEEALNLEYMPFYFHDLRTDEIFSMPAFISSISDDFAPEYNESQGFGRTDPVMIYSKTKRTIGLTFKMVSYSQQDHSYMWFVINKLVAMCYPQRSVGQKRLAADGKTFFIQPFSQVPTASPLVRIRLGELLHSNYSKRNLGRLFGLFGAPGRSNLVNVDQTQEANAAFAKQEFERNFNKLHAQELETLFTKGEKPGFDIELLAGTINLTNGEATAGVQCDIMALSPVTLKIDKVVKDPAGLGDHVMHGTVAKKGIFDSKKDVEEALKPFGAAGAKMLEVGGVADQVPPNTDTFPTLTIRWTASLTSFESFTFVGLEQEALKQVPADAADHANLEKRKEFLSAKTNPIVASFESSRGRGLAGFITQLTLGYEESLWEDLAGKRGPQMVEINMSFAPVHDLPLGLDADGNLMAPSHPIGDAVSTDPYMDDSDSKTAKLHREKYDAKKGELRELSLADTAAFEPLANNKNLNQ